MSWNTDTIAQPFTYDKHLCNLDTGWLGSNLDLILEFQRQLTL